jgi:hypothetical protein
VHRGRHAGHHDGGPWRFSRTFRRMERRRGAGGDWWRGAPWWAWVVIVAGTAFLAVGTAYAMSRGHVSGAEIDARNAADATATTTATTTPVAAPFQPPTSATLLDDFAGRASEAIETAPTGQAWTLTGDNPLELTDAGMTIDGIGAGYTTTDLGAVPTSVGASVVFEAGAPGAVATLLVSAGPSLDLNNMGVHYYFDATGWTLQVREDGEDPFPVIDSGQFAPPLAADGATAYTVNIAIDGDTLTVTHADGTTTTATDPRVGANLSGNVAWEVFRTDVATSRPVFQRVWATV